MKIKKIKLTVDVGISGDSYPAGTVLKVPEEITTDDARILLSIGRAEGTDEDKPVNTDRIYDVAKTLGFKKADKLSVEELSGELAAFSAKLMDMDAGELGKIASKLDLNVGDKSRDDLALEIADNIESVLDI